MRTISGRAWCLVVLSSALQILMFPTGGPVPAWRPALTWVALVPFFMALLCRGTDGENISAKATMGLGYACGILWFFGNCFWIYQTMYLYGGLPKPVAFGIVILFSLYLGLYHALFAALFGCIRNSRLGPKVALLMAPVLWVAVELARARVTGFPWDLLGNTLVDNLVVTRIAPVAGVMGISFLVAAMNAALCWYVVGARRARWAVPAMGLVFVFLVSLLPGAGGEKSLPKEWAVLLQENLSVGVTGRGTQPISVQDELTQFSKASLNPKVLDQVSGQVFFNDLQSEKVQADVIVWPEAPAHLQSDDPYFRAHISELVKEAHTPAIIGSLGVDQDNTSPRGYYLYDSAVMFDPSGNYSGRYDKIHLVPWGEYIPFKRFFGFAQKLTEGVGDMDPGHERSVFHAGGHAYGVFICYESIFGDEVREFAKNGAEVLVNISDDGWYGDTGAPWQHLNMARMRAIENNRWVLRSTNTGVTTAIDPLGRIAAEAPRHVRGAFAFPFAFVHGTTFYTQHGDWFAYLCALVSLATCGLAWARRAVPQR